MGACDTTPSGGVARGGASSSAAWWLALPSGVPGTIRCTLDGLPPTVASPSYGAAVDQDHDDGDGAGVRRGGRDGDAAVSVQILP